MQVPTVQFINYLLTDGLPFLIAIISVAVFVLAAIFFRSTPESIGNIGESRTARYLQKLPQDSYAVFNDLIVADSEGRTTQIDHIVVSRYGIFVVETKCYKGWIFGNPQNRTWTQTLWTGRGWYASSEKYQFQNPIRQNWRHIYVLAEKLRLPKNMFFNVVVFSGSAEFKTNMPYNVMTEYDVAAYIESYSDTLLSEATMKRICSSLYKLALHSDATHKEMKTQHVEMLCEYHNTESEDAFAQNAPVCPNCGAAMRKRHRRSDSAPFYGCVRYPMCKGTRSI